MGASVNFFDATSPAGIGTPKADWVGENRYANPSVSFAFVVHHPLGPRAFGLSGRAPMDDSRRRQVEKPLKAFATSSVNVA
jgi:hypothetical protein